METLFLIITIIRRYVISFLPRRKIKLDQNQYNVVITIATELGIPKEEVLWIFVEFGQMLAITSQQDKMVSKSINKRKKYCPEYKNWEEIAKLNYKYWKAGEELSEKT